MDRGFNFLFQGNRSNFGGGHNGPNFRERADRSDRRYDDFYADRNRVGPPGPNRNTGGGVRRSGDWNRQPRYQGGNNKFRRGSGGPRPGDKRKSDTTPSGFNKTGRKFSPAPKKKSTGSTTSKDSPKKEKEEPKIEEIDIPDDEVVVPDSLMDSVEKLRQRKEVERNVADEDVQKLLVFCFTGKGYQCKTCGLLLMKESAFLSHLMGKSHVMNVIDARTAKKYQEIRDILEIDLTPDDWFEKNDNARAIIMKQSKLHMKTQLEIKMREEANYNKTPSNFFNFNMELRKSVTKKEDKVVMTSLVESTVEVKDFTGEKFFGCEFVRAVTGFHCRLCSINIREAKGVIPHVDSRQHKNNYAAYVRKNPDYEKTQKEQNQDLYDIMTQHEAKSVVLAESPNVDASHFLSLLNPELVRIPSVMNPELKKEKEKEKEQKEKEAAEKEKKEKEKKDESDAASKDKDVDDTKENEQDGEEQDDGQDEGNEDADTENAAEEEQGDEGVKEEEEAVTKEEADEQGDLESEETEPVEPMEEGKEEETETKEGEDDEKKDADCSEEVADAPAEDKKEEKKEEPKEETKETKEKEGKSLLKKKLLEKPAKTTPAKKTAAKTTKSATKSTAKTKKAVDNEKQEETSDGNFMDGFEVVDEVADDTAA